MKLRTPEISWFARKAILSIDFHSDTSLPGADKGYRRLATCALPDDEQFVRLWKIGFDTSNDVLNISVTYLCGLGYHETVVNVVKFSPCGPYLAAGDSDGMVVVWRLQETMPEAPDVFSENNDEDKPLEKWTPWRRFRDHLPRKDVLDVCWSADGAKLVSCSIDHSLIVWDVEKGNRLALIKEHESRHPMGVAWDPQSGLFVSLSNSRTMSVYNADNFRRISTVSKASVPSLLEPEKEIVSKIFHDDTLFSLSRRLCFSPCGELLFVPAGVVEEGPKTVNVTYIFTRHQLAKPAVALTSSKEIPFTVRCCPRVFELRSTGPPSVFDLPYRIVFAVLTKSSVIFYDTQSCQPFAYVSNFQYGRALDMAWTGDGNSLAVCAEEGYCTFIQFDSNELGIPLKDIPTPAPPPPLQPPKPLSPPLSSSVAQSPNTLSKWLTPLK